MYCIDIALGKSELEALKASVLLSIKELPRESIVGLMTFGKHVQVYEFGQTALPKCAVFGGEAGADANEDNNITSVKIRSVLGLKNSQTAPNSKIWRYCRRVEEAQQDFEVILDNLEGDS